MQFIFGNNIKTSLSQPLNSGATTLYLSSTANLPTIGTGQLLPLTIQNGSTFEVVYASSITGSSVIVERAQEGTSDLSWAAGTTIYCGHSAGTTAASGGNPSLTFHTADATETTHAANLGQLQSGAVVLGGGIASATVTGANIASATVTGANIAGGTIGEGNLGGGSVHQGQLSVSTASGNVTLAPLNQGTYGLTGGPWALWAMSSSVQSGVSGTVTYYNIGVVGGAAGQGLGVLGITNFAHTTVPNVNNTIYIQELYFNSSPPYNEGPLFIYMGFNKAGERTHICVAPDPTWAHHGPTSLIPKRIDKGRKFTAVKTLNGIPISLIAKDLDHDLFPKWLAREGIEDSEVEITKDYKDADRDLEPHPWHHTPSDTQFCLIEPGSDLLVRLHDLYQESDADTVRKIVEKYVKIGDVCDKNAPKGMVIRRAKWVKK